jgi:magnesium and cobalt exporter, CNNM family
MASGRFALVEDDLEKGKNKMKEDTQTNSEASASHSSGIPKFSFNSILAPTDFSPNSEKAVDYATELARRLGARLTLLHIIPEPSALELRLVLQESAKAAQISGTSQEIVANAFEMRRRLVREVMTPRVEVVYLDIGLSFHENLQRAKAARYTRFPLCAGHFDHTIGLIHIKDMLAQLDQPEPSLLAVRKELLIVPEMLPLEKLLTRFRDRQARLAVVVDEFGGNVGIVTLQHVIAEIIGDMPDEFDVGRREFQRISESEFLVDGSLAIHEMRDLAGLEWEDEDVTTVGGYVVRRIGHLPVVGEQLCIDGYHVTIEQANGRRVQQVRFYRVAKSDPQGQ